MMRSCLIIYPSFKRRVDDAMSSLLLAYRFGFGEMPPALLLCFSCSLIMKVSRSFHFFFLISASVLPSLSFLTFIFSFWFHSYLLPVIRDMASFGSQNFGRTPSGETLISANPSSNVHVSACSSSLKYKLYPIEVIFSSPEEPWVSDDHVPCRRIDTMFSKCVETKQFEGQATTCRSSMTDIALRDLQNKHLILDKYILSCHG